MDKKGFIPPQVLAVIGLLIFVFFVLPLISQVFRDINYKCPECDCSEFQNKLINCEKDYEILLDTYNSIPLIYINQTVEVPVEKIVYEERFIPGGIIVSISLILSFLITFKLFNIEIKLPKELEMKLKRMDYVIESVKWMSLIVTILIFIKLLFILL